MKITPLEIRQKTFEKNFRGYDKDEVNGYLLSLSQEWEKMLDENKELTIKLKSSEREVEKLREVENSLFKTLKTAEDTGANIMEQANKTAELHMRETEFKAEAILNDARNKARAMLEEAELNSRDAYEEMEAQVKAMTKLYHTLENLRDDLLSDIKSVTTEINDKVTRATNHVRRFDVDQQLMEIRKMTVKGTSAKKKKNLEELPHAEEPTKLPQNTETAAKENIPKEKAKPETTEEPKEKAKAGFSDSSDKSFFDEIE